jgi:hypothetical protein
MKGYRPIALLNTIEKILEKIMTTRFSEAAETHKLLPEQQMGAKKKQINQHDFAADYRPDSRRIKKF